MNTKLVIAVIAALNVGLLAGCSDGSNPVDAQAAPVAATTPATAPIAAVLPTSAAEVAPEPVDVEVASEPAVVADAPEPVAAAPTPAPKPRQMPKPEPAFAKVVSVQDAIETISEPREVCTDVEVVKQAPVVDEHRVAGTVAGAAAGAVIGNQIGDGKGRKIARIVGIVGGAVAGNKIQQKMQEADTVKEMERRCETVTETREEHRGYDVTYTYAGRTTTVRMQTKPGTTLPVKNGEVVTG